MYKKKRLIPEPYGYIPVELGSLYKKEWLLGWSATDNDSVYLLDLVSIVVKTVKFQKKFEVELYCVLNYFLVSYLYSIFQSINKYLKTVLVIC